MCVFVFKDILLNIYCQFINIEYRLEYYISCLNEIYPHILSEKDMIVLSHLGTLHYNFVLFGDYLNSKITKQKNTKNEKNAALNKFANRQFLFSLRARTGGQSIALFDLTWEHVRTQNSLFYVPIKNKRTILKGGNKLSLSLLIILISEMIKCKNNKRCFGDIEFSIT